MRVVSPGQLRAWRGVNASPSAPGCRGGECFLVLGRTPTVSLVSTVWRILLSTGEVLMYDTEFLELESDELNT